MHYDSDLTDNSHLLPSCAPAALPAGRCESDSDCQVSSKGSICEQASTTTTCTCSAGADACKQLGTCIGFCDSTQAKRKLATANSQVVACDPFLPNTCSGGLVCQPSSAGVQLVCRDEAGIVPVEIGGVCAPADRRLLSARFSPDGKHVAIALNAAARTAAFSCSGLFTPVSSAALGTRAWCSVADRVLTVQLDGGSATLMPDEALNVQANQSVLVDKLQSDVPFTGSTVVTGCSECAPPIAALTGPQVSIGAGTGCLPQSSGANRLASILCTLHTTVVQAGNPAPSAVNGCRDSPCCSGGC